MLRLDTIETTCFLLLSVVGGGDLGIVIIKVDSLAFTAVTLVRSEMAVRSVKAVRLDMLERNVVSVAIVLLLVVLLFVCTLR